MEVSLEQFATEKYTSSLPIMFHHFHGENHKDDRRGSFSSEELERLIDQIGRKYILSPHEWIEKFREGRLDTRDTCFTFDDGLKSQEDVAYPLLESLGMGAFWFVYSGPFLGKLNYIEILRRLTSEFYEQYEEFCNDFLESSCVEADEIIDSADFQQYRIQMVNSHPFYTNTDLVYRFTRDRVLNERNIEVVATALATKRGTTILELAKSTWLTSDFLDRLNLECNKVGLHSFSHPNNLKQLSYLDQQREYLRNLDHLSVYMGTSVTMAHPCNSFNRNTLQILSDLEVELGFCSSHTGHQGDSFFPHLTLPRIDASHLRN